MPGRQRCSPTHGPNCYLLITVPIIYPGPQISLNDFWRPLRRRSPALLFRRPPVILYAFVRFITSLRQFYSVILSTLRPKHPGSSPVHLEIKDKHAHYSGPALQVVQIDQGEFIISFYHFTMTTHLPHWVFQIVIISVPVPYRLKQAV